MEWWQLIAEGLPVGSSRKVTHPEDVRLGKSPSVLIYNTVTGYGWKCFRRGEHGWKGKDYINLQEVMVGIDQTIRDDLPTDMEPYNPLQGDALTELANRYLLKRGLDPQIVVGANSYLSKERGRLILKCQDTRGNTGYLGRDITEKHQAKSITYTHERQQLANCVLPVREGNTYVIVEDINSAMKIQEAIRRDPQQLANCVISLNGTSGCTSLSLYLLDANVIVWLDGDEAGRRGAFKLSKDLTPIVSYLRIVQGEGDPKDYTYTEIQKILKYHSNDTRKDKLINIQEVLCGS